MEKETNLKQKEQRLIYVFNHKDSTDNKIKRRKKKRRKKKKEEERKKYNWGDLDQELPIVFNCLSIVYFLWFQSYIYFI